MAPVASRPTRAARHSAVADRPTEDDIAPIPTKLKWLGVWADRTFGAIPLAAPLLVSGYYTVGVFVDEPINAHPIIALAATAALEGGLWKLCRLLEKTLVAGDSTIALRFGIGGYLGIISGLIYWHAYHQAALEGRTDIGWDWIPAAGVAVMCALGVFIWSRTARWLRRRELAAAGRVDKQAPKFSGLSWVLTPIETPFALRHAVKWRIDSPIDAVTDRRLYKTAGKPTFWEPLAWKPTDEDDWPTDDQPTTSTDCRSQPPTRPEATAQPTTTSTTTRPSDNGQPTVPTRPAPTASTLRPTTTTANRPTPTASTRTASEPTDQTSHTPAAVANAGYLREHYGPSGVPKLATIRADLKWSFDRANNALRAYNDGADLADRPTNDKERSPDRPADALA